MIFKPINNKNVREGRGREIVAKKLGGWILVLGCMESGEMVDLQE